MISVISGFAVTGAGAAGLWLAMPKHGVIHWTAKAPVLDWLIPTAIVAALSIGVALIVSGLVT